MDLDTGAVEHARVLIERGFFDFEEFYKAYEAHTVDERNALIHFRITTRGDTSPENCHPFPLAEGALVHNGTLDNLGEKGKGKSDTRELSELLFHEELGTLKRLKPLMEAYFDYNKVAVLHNTGEFLVFNEGEWIEEDGVLFSNDSYLDNYYSKFDWKDWRDWQSSPGGTALTPTGRGSYSARISDEEFDSYFSDEFEWEGGMLFRSTYRGDIFRDFDTEEAVYEAWYDDNTSDPISEEDWDVMDDITAKFINHEEYFRCPSTPHDSRPPTATPSGFLPTISTALSPTPSSSMARLPVSTATSAAPPIQATA